MPRRLTALLPLTALAAAAAVLGTAGPATASTADGSITLGVNGFRDIVVDATHVFITTGGSSGVLVRDLEGAAVTTITNEPGASQMVLSPDGTRLYVALFNGDAVAAIDTSTLAEVARYSTGAGTCPSTLALAGSKLFFGYGCNDAGNAGLIDLSADTPTAALTPFPASSFLSGTPQMTASPALPGKLVTVSNHLQVWDVTGASPTSLASIDTSSQDLALSPDGSHVITTNGSPYDHQAYKTSDLSADGVYGYNNPYPNAVAASSTGLVAAGILGNYDKDLNIYKADGTFVRGYDFGYCCSQHQPTSLQSRGLAFDATASRVYAVVTDYVDEDTTLKVLHDPGTFPSGMTLTAPSGASYNKPFAVKGKLVSTGLPAGRTITVTRDTNGASPTPRAPVTTAADGTFTITDTVSGRGTFGYTASFAGDADHAAASKRVVVSVSGVTPSLSITTASGPYAYGAKPVVVAHLGSTRLRTVSIYAQQYGGTRRLLKTGTVDSHGDLRVAYTITRRTTFTASFAGDSLYNPRAVAKVLLSKAALSTRMAGYYGSSGAYKLFHTSTDPLTPVTVGPNNAGACISFVVQRIVSGSWKTTATNSCVNLDSSSRTIGELYGTHVAGTTYRLMATFNGTTLNARTSGPWLYFKFTR